MTYRLPSAELRPVSSYPDRAALLRDRADSLRVLIRADLSRPRALLFLLCAVAMSCFPVLAPGLFVDAIAGDDSTATELAVAFTLTATALGVFGVIPALTLHRMRGRSRHRWSAIQRWVVLDRHPEARALPAGNIPESLALPYDLRQGNVREGTPTKGVEVPEEYGSGQFPHIRWLTAVVLCVTSVMLVIVVIAVEGIKDPPRIGLAVALGVFALCMGSVVNKVGTRSGWCSDERRLRRLEESRMERSAALLAGHASDEISVPAKRFPSEIVWFALPLIVVGVGYITNRPDDATGYAVAASVSGIVLALGVVVISSSRFREQRQFRVVATSIAAHCPGEVFPVRHGLQPENLVPNRGLESWDFGPPRVSGLVLGEDSLLLCRTDGASHEVPFSDLLGAVVLRVPRHDIELLQCDGQALQIRSTEPQSIIDALREAGVRVRRAHN
ncbi:hypothetical protein [Streptomyces sp. NPDC051776]|uniref:hypothetical protein n=1 Tax=Streptomyces sp. NPDC051776 TaxID=3155414 RepID=UPI003440DBB9